MANVIALAQQKGGVMKSTLAIHLAVELTHAGKRVAIIDADSQKTVMTWHKHREAEAPHVVAADAMTLADKLAALADMDFVLLDLPGRRGSEMLIGMREADFILVPMRPLDTDIWACHETILAAQRMEIPFAFVMTIVPPDGRRAREYTSALEAKGYRCLSTPIMHRVAYSDAVSEGLGVREYSPRNRATAEIAALTKEITDEFDSKAPRKRR